MIIKLLMFNTIDFATYVLGAFVFFSAGLLFVDSWKLSKDKKTTLIRGGGFFLLSTVYIVYAASIQNPTIIVVAQIVKIISLISIFYSLVAEPILTQPTNKLYAIALPLVLPAFSQALVPLSAAFAFMVSLWYLRRATKGLDKQLKPAAIAFFFIFLSELIRIAFFKTTTLNVFWAQALAPHAIAWNLHIVFQLIGIIVLGVWVWGYVRFRIQIQLFATILASSLAIFLLTTFFFSFLLLKNLEDDALSHLKTDANVFQYALDRLQLESLAHARALAADNVFKEALIANDTSALYEISSRLLLSQDLASLAVTSSTGEVLMRAENKENIGDDISENETVKSALSGQQLSSLTLNSQAINPEILIKSAVPVSDSVNNEVLGTVITGFIVDNAFVDGVKAVTGLDATIFAGEKRSATTIISPDGKSRFVGTIETNETVLAKVLENGETFVGTSEILNEPYYTAYAPLKTFREETIGMLFIGKPQTHLLETAQRSINLTFMGSALLMVISTIPAYFVSRYIRENVEA